ncbi:unnamed protein product [Withania somnifera]
MADKNQLKKRKLIKKSDSVATPSENQQKKKAQKPNNPTRIESDPLPVKIQKLLEPYTKEQMTPHAKPVSVFEQYGEIEECNVVMDHATGKAKGYAFVMFNKRKSAEKALQQPSKTVNNRLWSFKLASMKETVGSLGSNEFGNRKIYVSNVPKDVDSERLRMFLAKFGEIEVGPMGFDVTTGKCKGYAFFVYKTVEDAKRCLEEPCKMFEGRQLCCKKAADGRTGGGGAASITTEIVQQPLLATSSGQGAYGPVVGAQSMGMLGQNANVAMMNPFTRISRLDNLQLLSFRGVVATRRTCDEQCLTMMKQSY